MCLGVFLKNKFVIVLINFSLKLIINFIMYFVGLYSTATPGEWCSPRYGEFGPGGAGMTRSLGENPSLTGPGSEGHEWRE